ncbi:cellulose biosynthesis protein BcsQ, partial [Leptospira sp. SA-E8]|uniref:cellulose biosynthesis protein BcsQ n=1 Tax=Leptospira sp. SA-E8 TaxID=3422259 RepID=UPI003EBD4D07
ERAALALDFSPVNALRLHFGMAWAAGGGWAGQVLQNRDWHTAAWRDGQGRHFLPFGTLDDDAALERLTRWLRERPRWLRDQLAAVQLEPGTVVVCDCPLAPSALRDQVLAAADMLVLVCAPDSLSYASATHMAGLAAEARRRHAGSEHPGPAATIVLNGFDPSRRLDRDIALLLRTQYKSVFSPVIVHRDESLREALACKQTVFDFAPGSQAAYDYTALATWTLARLGQTHDPAGRAGRGQGSPA